MNNSKNVLRYMFGSGALNNLGNILEAKKSENNYVVYCIDEYFENSDLIKRLPIKNGDEIFYIQTNDEPKTKDIDNLRDKLISRDRIEPKAIVAIGGGCTLDTGKAIANLLTNPGNAEDYQGWDLVKNPAIYKIGIPTISGTGAEASRTCVMTNPKNGLKLGMNSDFTIYDQLILDPDLTKTVERNQYFYTGMDTYLHCVESLNGNHRNAIGDAFSHQSISLCRDIFLSEDMMSDENRQKLMVASYLGGCAIANSFVGLVHPFSAGLSVVFGTHHCIGNCIAMNALGEFYPNEIIEFRQMALKQGIVIPKGIAKYVSEDVYERLYDSTIIHEKPLKNALGDDFKEILTYKKVREIFRNM
ncbi:MULTISPECIES: iron-containing alcohol dehydrogenase family protein [unclassified Campylobacter]|uniref:iron-containing alcohol dehydrogenase family protein n=1 Tax=unclassified Campylobacter TaxID=2593542 RepID=UPI003D34B5E2